MANKAVSEFTTAMRRMPGLNRVSHVNKGTITSRLGVTAVTSAIDQVIGSSAGGVSTLDDSLEKGLSTASPEIAPTDSRGVTIDSVLKKRRIKNTHARVGQVSSQWQNVFVRYAIPILLKLQTHNEKNDVIHISQRNEFAIEVKYFRERLVKAGCDWNDVTEASYVLCTFVDESASALASRHQQSLYDGEKTLLVDFHGDAWGGEDAFSCLERSLVSEPLPIHLLGFYDVILSLGWQGRYAAIERGEQQLADLRARLTSTIWQNEPLPVLGPSLSPPPNLYRSWWTIPRILLGILSGLLLLYVALSIDLGIRSSKVKASIKTWTPPLTTIDIRETLPPPLPELISEGWLSAYQHPLGWLLVFRSDGAFDVGSADIRTGYINNIERLGRALAPWPGNLEVIGHTDIQPVYDGGLYADNLALSEARAKNVANALVRLIRPHDAVGGSAIMRQITYSGRGDIEPIDASETDQAFERNRRVEVLWKIADLTPAQLEKARSKTVGEYMSIGP